MSEEILGPEPVHPYFKPRPEDGELVLSEAGKFREAVMEVVRHYLHEDKTSLVAELQNSSPADLIDCAIG